LWNSAQSEVLGLATVEKYRREENTAELCGWLHPKTNRYLARNAWIGLMSWAQRTSGYSHFIAHTEKETNEQRGNPRAVRAAFALGFKEAGTRAADDPNGNGRPTQILRAPDWKSPKLEAV
jgi:hypothetical protein